MLHQALTRNIEGCGGFIEYQHSGVCNKCPGKGHQLALTGREPAPALIHVGVIALGQSRNKIMRSHSTGCLVNFLERGIWFSQANVFGNAAGEHIRLLGDQDHGLAKIAIGDVAKIDPIQGNNALRGVIKTCNQLGKS